jgi:dipeptidyl aminopeptidase/acylaminoacyl peptidase
MTLTPAETLIPRSVLFGNPEKTYPQISPDGRNLAYLAPVNDVLNIWVGKVGSQDYQPITRDTDRGIHFYIWAADSQHLLYMQDVGGDENWRLYATNIETKKTRDLTPFEPVQVRIIACDQHFPDEILLGMNKENPQVHDVYRLVLSSGELTLVAKNPGTAIDWVVDAQLKVRGCVATLADGGTELLVRDDEQSAWRSVLTWSLDDGLNNKPVGFTADGQALYLEDARDVNATRLVKLHLTSGKLSIIAEDRLYDVGCVITHPDTYEVQAVAFIKDHLTWSVLDESIGSDFAALSRVQRGDFLLISRDDADSTWIVAYFADDRPVSFYVYDRRTRLATFLFAHQSVLYNYALAQMEPIKFLARDGWTIHGYLTMPVEKKRSNLPMILNVHGGPWGRDTWQYNSEVQWFANRGYACLQVNFRGSLGYGKDFLNAGNREWGRNMHHDLVDAVHWAIRQGIADPEKVAIYGGSYGGYAALVGATFTPNLFRCAIASMGPSNLITFIRAIPPYWSAFRALFHKRVGNPDTEEAFLVSCSPLFKAERITIPILLVQGANDPRVKQAEAEQIVAAMQNNSINYEYLLFPDEGHGLAKPENRLKFYTVAEKFLAQHLGGLFEE